MNTDEEDAYLMEQTKTEDEDYETIIDHKDIKLFSNLKNTNVDAYSATSKKSKLAGISNIQMTKVNKQSAGGGSILDSKDSSYSSSS